MAISETQIENGTFRVTRWELEPGDTIPAHVHEYEYVVVPLTEGTLRATAPDGTETAVELSIGQSYARRQVPRTPSVTAAPPGSCSSKSRRSPSTPGTPGASCAMSFTDRTGAP